VNYNLPIDGEDCEARQLDKETDATFFGIKFGKDGTESIAGPSSVLHFNNGYNQVS
jgi:hypothetical protein